MDKQKGSALSRQAVVHPSSLADATFSFAAVGGPLHGPWQVFRDLADLRSCSGVMAEMKSGDAQGGEGPLPPTIGPMGGGVRRMGVPQIRRLCRVRVSQGGGLHRKRRALGEEEAGRILVPRDKAAM